MQVSESDESKKEYYDIVKKERKSAILALPGNPTKMRVGKTGNLVLPRNLDRNPDIRERYWLTLLLIQLKNYWSPRILMQQSIQSAERRPSAQKLSPYKSP
jgi:hypothetical protein